MITELQLGDIKVDVVFKDIKNIHLSVYPPTGRVRISAPERMDAENIRLFAISKLGWIKKQQKKLQAQDRESPREYLDRESHYLWGKRYLLQILERSGLPSVTREHKKIVLSVPPGTPATRRQELLDDFYRAELKQATRPLIAKWESQLDIRVQRFFVQRMKTKWGSSNPNLGTIRLNLELAKKPHDCLDYVVLHEMAHFLVPDHGKKFQSLMDHYLPSWPNVRQRLNETSLAHEEWAYSDFRE